MIQGLGNTRGGKKEEKDMTILLLLLTNTYAQYNYIAPHVRSDGTFVQGHFRSRPDGNPYNNINPPSHNGINLYHPNGQFNSHPMNNYYGN